MQRMLSRQLCRRSARPEMDRHGAAVRHFSDPLGSFSVLGTSAVSPKFMEQFKEDLLEEERKVKSGSSGFGDIMKSCISKGDLEHMESPEADVAHAKKVDKMMENLFSRIPTPKDPLRVALAPTKEEIAESERFEVLKEAVRERYQQTKSRRKAEESRIQAAMKRVEDGTHPALTSNSKFEEYEAYIAQATGRNTASPSSDAQEGDDDDSVALERELEEMRRKVAALETRVGKKRKVQ